MRTISLNSILVLIVLIGLIAAAPVNLGTANNYAVLAKTSVTATSGSTINGNVGLGTSDAGFLGFAQVKDPSNVSSTSSEVNGKLYATNYAAPTPATLATALNDLNAASSDIAGRYPDISNPAAEDIGGRTFAPGTYAWGGAVTMAASTNVILNGSATDIWIFQISGALSTGAGSHIYLMGGAKPENVFWVSSAATSLGANSLFNGNIMSGAATAIGAGATINGRIFSKTSITLDGDTITPPASPITFIPATPVPPTNTTVITTTGWFSQSGSSTPLVILLLGAITLYMLRKSNMR